MKRYSINNEDYTYTELEDAAQEAGVGQVIYEAEAIKPTTKDILHVETILEYFETSAYDQGGEYSDNILDKVDDDAKAELEKLLCDWGDKHLTFGWVNLCLKSIKEIVVTEDML